MIRSDPYVLTMNYARSISFLSIPLIKLIHNPEQFSEKDRLPNKDTTRAPDFSGALASYRL